MITPDPIKQLEEAINWHREQIDTIKKAIEVLKGSVEGHETSSKVNIEEHKIAWSREIDNIFKKNDNLTLDQVITKLIENGFDESIVLKNRSVVYTTIIRKCKDGSGKKLNKKNGVYSNIIKSTD